MDTYTMVVPHCSFVIIDFYYDSTGSTCLSQAVKPICLNHYKSI